MECMYNVFVCVSSFSTFSLKNLNHLKCCLSTSNMVFDVSSIVVVFLHANLDLNRFVIIHIVCVYVRFNFQSFSVFSFNEDFFFIHFLAFCFVILIFIFE